MDSNTNTEKYTLLIGEVSSTYGLKGHVWTFPHTDYPERFLQLKRVIVGKKFMEISSAKINQGRVILKFKGIDHINDAEKLKGAKIFIKGEDKVELQKDEYFYDDLLGIEVITESGESLGRIENIIKTGANDVYETKKALIPAVKEFIKEVNITNGYIKVIYREGLKK